MAQMADLFVCGISDSRTCPIRESLTYGSDETYSPLNRLSAGTRSSQPTTVTRSAGSRRLLVLCEGHLGQPSCLRQGRWNPLGGGQVALHERAYNDLWNGRVPRNRARKEIGPRSDCLDELDCYHVLVYECHSG